MATEMKEIPIGAFLLQKVTERGFSEERLCKFFGCSASEISEMYEQKSIETELLLKWSKLLEYDFFRHYSRHLIFSDEASRVAKNKTYTTLPHFRKNIYSPELIEYVLEKINKGEKTMNQIVEEYGVPKTTIYRWKTKQRPMDGK